MLWQKLKNLNKKNILNERSKITLNLMKKENY